MSEQGDSGEGRAPIPPAVHTAGTLTRVPNQPKTPVRGFRIPEDLYRAAQRYAKQNGEDLTAVVRRALERYVKREEKKQRTQP